MTPRLALDALLAGDDGPAVQAFSLVVEAAGAGSTFLASGEEEDRTVRELRTHHARLGLYALRGSRFVRDVTSEEGCRELDWPAAERRLEARHRLHLLAQLAALGVLGATPAVHVRDGRFCWGDAQAPTANVLRADSGRGPIGVDSEPGRLLMSLVVGDRPPPTSKPRIADLRNALAKGGVSLEGDPLRLVPPLRLAR